MINRVILVGRPTKEIELKKTQSGASVVSFTLAVNRRYKQDGQQDADFISCQAWNKVAELTNQYVSKGMLIGIEGRIQTRNYDDKDGKRVYVTEVIAESVQFLESRQKDESNQTSNYSQPTQNYQPQEQDAFKQEFGGDTLELDASDLPF